MESTYEKKKAERQVNFPLNHDFKGSSRRHFMITDEMLARIERAFPDKSQDFTEDVYGDLCRLLECFIYWTPEWLLKAYFARGFNGDKHTLAHAIRFAKEDVVRRRKDRFEAKNE